MNHKCVLLGLLALIFAVMAMGNCSDVSDADDKGSSGSMNYEFTASDGKLTISGSGNIPDYELISHRPWASYTESIKTVIIDSSITGIGKRAFYNCSNLSSVEIPDTVTYIGPGAFRNCSLTSVDIPASVETLGSSAFNGCTNLKSATLHDGLKTIDSSTFTNCTSLESIIIPDSVTKLGDQAFYKCSSLKELSFPLHLNAVQTVTEKSTGESFHVFEYCDNITTITFTGTGSGSNYSTDSGSDTYYQNTPWYTNRDHLTQIVWKCDNLQSIGSNTFRGLTALTTVTIGENILSIEDYAFYGCSNLQTITANDKILSIGASAFGNCLSLTSITVPDSVLTVGASAFGNCLSLTSVTVGSGIRYIGADAFKGVTFYDGKTVLNADADSLLNRSFSGTVSKMMLTSTVKYTVKFVTDNGTFFEYRLEYNGTIIAPPEKPTKDSDAAYSYTFEKWDGFTEGMLISTEDVTFEAVFTKTLNKYAYSVMFTTGSREVAPAISGTADYGTVIDIAPVTVAGYTTPQPSSVTVTENAQHNYLVYGYQPIIYTLTFNDGVKTTSVNYTVETASINVPDVTEKKGYSGVWETYNLSDLANQTVTATYTPIEYTFTFDDGIKSTPVRFTVETTEINEPALTEKTGYTGDWEKYDLKDLNDRTVKAQYTAKNYHVRFISEGVVFYEYDLGFGSPIVLPAEVPTKAADTQYTYTFQRWDGFTEGMTLGASDMSFEALFGSQSVVRTDTEGKVWIESDTDVPLSAKQIESIKTDAENNNAVTLTLSSGECKATFDNTALTSLKIDSDAVFSIESVPADEMTQEVRDIVKDNTLYSISFGSNTDFGNGTVTVTVPYELNGKDPSGLSVCYISEGKIAEKLDCTYDNGTVTFETKHFSLYAIIPSEKENNSDVIYIAAALIALFAVFAVGVVLRKRSS